MTRLNPEFCRKIKQARRDAGLSQSELAAEIGCKQPALSMFEQGDGTKLGDEAVLKLSKKFGIPLCESAASDGIPESAAAQPSVVAAGTGFCPNPECPSNSQYSVDGRVFRRPDRKSADPVGGRFCAVCGEILERKCPTCGAAVHDGAVCTFCGKAYVN